MHFVGIEIGESATRVAALDLESATVVAEAESTHAWVEGMPEECREQDPSGWITALNHALGEVLETLGERRGDVVAMGVTAPSGGVVVLDENDRVVRPAKRGSDGSGKRQVEALGKSLGGAPGLTELIGNAPWAGSMAAQVRWLKEHEPQHFERAARLMTAQDFIGYWLTGEAGTSVSTAATTGLFSIPRRDWCRELVETIDGELTGRLEPVLEAGRARGMLREALARRWGLSPEVLVSAGIGAEAAAVFAAGAALPGELVLDLSPDGALVAVTEGCVVDFLGEGTVGCDVAGNGFTRMAMRNVVAAPELVRRHYGWSEAEAARMLSTAAPGADGLLFLPYLRGEAVPRLIEGTGVLHGLTLDNFTPANLARAAAEGVALGFGYAMSRLGDMAFEARSVKLTRDAGPELNQLLADVIGLPVAAVSGGGGALLGAVMEAAVTYFRQNGESLGFDEVAGYMVTVDEATRREPDRERHDFYQSLLARQQYLVGTLHADGFL